MSLWWEALDGSLEQRKRDFLYRQRQTLDSPQGAVITLDGKSYLNFSSNDYLGMANHPQVVESFVRGAKQFGVGPGASHLVVGHQRPHTELEDYIAEITGRDRALLFSSGYMANLGVIRALLAKGDVIFQDKLNHASLIDAGLSSGANQYRYKHNDVSHLQLLLNKRVGSSASEQSENCRQLLAVDGVFSMDGDIAPLDCLSVIAKENELALMVDDAHGFGVLGDNGYGISEHFGLGQNELPILMGTFGKAMGVAGAFVAGNEQLIETLIQHARTYIYTTALPAACAVAAKKALELSQEESHRRESLHKLMAYFFQGVTALGIVVPQSASAIQPIVIGDSKTTLAISQALFDDGIHVAAIRSPTVPVGKARLRVALSAEHTKSDIDRLLASLSKALHRFSPALMAH